MARTSSQISILGTTKHTRPFSGAHMWDKNYKNNWHTVQRGCKIEKRNDSPEVNRQGTSGQPYRYLGQCNSWDTTTVAWRYKSSSERRKDPRRGGGMRRNDSKRSQECPRGFTLPGASLWQQRHCHPTPATTMAHEASTVTKSTTQASCNYDQTNNITCLVRLLSSCLPPMLALPPPATLPLYKGIIMSTTTGDTIETSSKSSVWGNYRSIYHYWWHYQPLQCIGEIIALSVTAGDTITTIVAQVNSTNNTRRQCDSLFLLPSLNKFLYSDIDAPWEKHLCK